MKKKIIPYFHVEVRLFRPKYRIKKLKLAALKGLKKTHTKYKCIYTYTMISQSLFSEI